MGSHAGCSIIPGGIPPEKGGIPPGTHLGSHLIFLPGCTCTGALPCVFSQLLCCFPCFYSLPLPHTPRFGKYPFHKLVCQSCIEKCLEVSSTSLVAAPTLPFNRISESFVNIPTEVRYCVSCGTHVSYSTFSHQQNAKKKKKNEQLNNDELK